jgi:hypothetical protein
MDVEITSSKFQSTTGEDRVMGEVKRRNRGAIHPSLPSEEAMRDTVFFEQLIRREVTKALQTAQVKPQKHQSAS